MIKTRYEALVEHMESWSVDKAYTSVADFTESEIDRGLGKGWITSELQEEWHNLDHSQQQNLVDMVNLQCGFDTPA
jgi:xanthine dehydrogenase iron-sulfur cluster and FAD-binding subunit A